VVRPAIIELVKFWKELPSGGSFYLVSGFLFIVSCLLGQSELWYEPFISSNTDECKFVERNMQQSLSLKMRWKESLQGLIQENT
jgi:hypothetical protein